MMKDFEFLITMNPTMNYYEPRIQKYALFFIYPKIVGDEYSDECMMNVSLIGWKKISVSNYLIS